MYQSIDPIHTDWKMSNLRQPEMVLSTPLVRKSSDSCLPQVDADSPSLSLISPPALVKYSTVTPYHYNLRTHHTPGFTHRWSSTPHSQLGTEGLPLLTKAFSSPAVIGAELQDNILDFEKRLEVLEENEVDSGITGGAYLVR